MNYNSGFFNIPCGTAILLIVNMFVNVQSEDRGVLFWFGPGTGFGNITGTLGTIQYGDYNALLSNTLLIKVRVANLVENSRYIDIPRNQIVDAGLLIGYSSASFANFKINASGGLSFVYSSKKQSIPSVIVIGSGDGKEYDRTIYRTLGFPLDLELLVILTKYLGIGLSGLVNLNVPSSYSGAALSFKIGKLK